MSNKKEVAVEVCNIHKDFILPQNKNSTFKQTVVNIVKKNNKVTQRVLDGVSFEVNKGDFFGIVGRNGSGKSTLLKLIAGVYTPTAGHIKINGGLTPFIELGVGFNPELSGRDNVYLNGALLGFSRKQMDLMYEEIVNFAELGQFMDQKLKNYSSGMQVRLAFSIAIKAKNEILIFDEVLAVGDEAFQRKCLDVFEEYKANGQTVILVTHDMKTVRNFCNRAVLINQGKIECIGNPKEVADKYSRLNQQVIDNEINKKQKQDDTSIVLYNDKEKVQNAFYVGEKVTIEVKWDEYINNAEIIMVELFKKSGEHITTFKSNNGTKVDKNKLANDQKIRLETVLMLAPGSYYFDLYIMEEKTDKKIVSNFNACEFVIVNDFSVIKKAWSGLFLLDSNWIQ